MLIDGKVGLKTATEHQDAFVRFPIIGKLVDSILRNALKPDRINQCLTQTPKSARTHDITTVANTSHRRQIIQTGIALSFLLLNQHVQTHLSKPLQCIRVYPRVRLENDLFQHR